MDLPRVFGDGSPICNAYTGFPFPPLALEHGFLKIAWLGTDWPVAQVAFKNQHKANFFPYSVLGELMGKKQRILTAASECGARTFSKKWGGPSALSAKGVEITPGETVVEISPTPTRAGHWRDVLAAAATWPGQGCASAHAGGSLYRRGTPSVPAASSELDRVLGGGLVAVSCRVNGPRPRAIAINHSVQPLPTGADHAAFM